MYSTIALSKVFVIVIRINFGPLFLIISKAWLVSAFMLGDKVLLFS